MTRSRDRNGNFLDDEFFYPTHHGHKKRHHHPKQSAAAIILVMAEVIILVKEKFMQVNLKWTTPAFRADGTTPLTLAEIAATNIFRNGAALATVNAVDASLPLGNVFSDTTPLTGSDTYVVETVTTDGFVSADSNSVVINVPAANPAAAISDLQGVLQTP